MQCKVPMTSIANTTELCSYVAMKATTKCNCKSEFLRVFNFAILRYSRNSRKLDAREKLLFYSKS